MDKISEKIFALSTIEKQLDLRFGANDLGSWVDKKKLLLAGGRNTERKRE